jgi:MoxR-like ATPase
VFASVNEVATGLRRCGYIADVVIHTSVHFAAALHKPILLEGPAGSGKTQLAYALVTAAGTKVERLQCYEGLNEDKAIGRFDQSLQQLCIQLKTQCAAPDWRLLQSELHAREFFIAGPLLRALECKHPCVLLIDELDKVDQEFEAMLLELLSAWQLSIPKLGQEKLAGRTSSQLVDSTVASTGLASCIRLA